MPEKLSTQPTREQDGFLDRIIHHHHKNQEKMDQEEAHPNKDFHDQPSKESGFSRLENDLHKDEAKLKNNLRKDEAKLKDYLREDEKLEAEGLAYGGLM